MRRALLILVACLWWAAPAAAQPSSDFQTWLAGVKTDAAKRGIAPEAAERALAGIEPIDRVLELDRRQPEFTLTFDDYMARVVSEKRVKRGRQMMAQNRALLRTVARRYGVPAHVIAALWGIETDFGRLTGGFPVIAALATLAYDGRRSNYFRGELFHALEMVDKHAIPAERMRGSWAGAMGQCQFMPSTYVKFAVSWTGGNSPDIWGNQADVFASAANYLAKSGWVAGETWGREVRLPHYGVAPELMGLGQRRSLHEWRRLGVMEANGRPLPAHPNILASLIRPEGGGANGPVKGRAYLVYANYRVFLKWNRSTYFALAAGTLADRLATH